jgi:hypothetical protein
LYLWKVRYIWRFLFLARMKSLTAAVSGSENAADPLDAENGNAVSLETENNTRRIYIVYTLL